MCLYTECTHRYLNVYSYFTWYTDCTHICSHRGACTQGCAHTSQVVQGICTHLYTQRSLNTQDAVCISYYDPTQNILWTQVHTFVHAKVPKHTEDVIKSHYGPNLHKTCTVDTSRGQPRAQVWSRRIITSSMYKGTVSKSVKI